MKNLIKLYNRKDLVSCEVYQINNTSKQKLYNIETKNNLENFIKNTTKNNWGLINEYIQFNYLKKDSILLQIKNKQR